MFRLLSSVVIPAPFSCSCSGPSPAAKSKFYAVFLLRDMFSFVSIFSPAARTKFHVVFLLRDMFSVAPALSPAARTKYHAVFLLRDMISFVQALSPAAKTKYHVVFLLHDNVSSAFYTYISQKMHKNLCQLENFYLPLQIIVVYLNGQLKLHEIVCEIYK